jgi:hypothetical protein
MAGHGFPPWRRRRFGSLVIVAPNGRQGQWVFAWARRWVNMHRAKVKLRLVQNEYHADACLVVVPRISECLDVLRSLEGKSPQQVREEQQPALDAWVGPPRPDPQLYKRRKPKRPRQKPHGEDGA